MSRYIDADALIEKEERYELDRYIDGERCYEMAVPSWAIIEAPSIDIVRCKECKWVRYCETEDLDLYLDCDKSDGGGIPRNEEWFCADGERKESE